MQITVGSTITVEQPSLELVAWCKENLKIVNPEYTQKLRMHLWTGNTPSHLYLYETRGTSLILPFGVLRRIKPLIPDDCSVYTEFHPSVKIDYQCSVPLYDYQQNAVDAVARNHYGILQSPAGSGKTQMGIATVAKLGRRTLWLTHTKDLLTQSKSRAELYMDPSLLGTITEGKVSIGEGITFATIQTMCRLDLNQYKHLWDVIIVDECHRCSGTPTAMTQFSKVLNSLCARHKYGLSATVHRSDGTIAATYAGLDEDGFLSALAADIIGKCKSYTEKSKSGRGFHIFLKGTLPFKGKNNLKGVEIYKDARFFITTGDVMLYSTIAENQEAIDYILEKYFPEIREESTDKVMSSRIYTPIWELPQGTRIKLRPVYPRIPDGCRNICLTYYSIITHYYG